MQSVFKKTCLYETKWTASDKMPFSRLEEHQKHYLQAAKHSTVNYKIPDAGFTNPADGFCLHHVDAYVVVKYHNHKTFYLIDIDRWIDESTHSKSLSIQRAKEIGIESYKLCITCGQPMPMHKRFFCCDGCQRKNTS